MPNQINNSIKEIDDPSKFLDGTRIYIQGSMWDRFANGKRDFTDGPDNIQNPEDFFKDSFYNYGFNPEVGSVGFPVVATIRATMPQEGWQIPIFKKLSDGIAHDQIGLYGKGKDLDDFCEKAQLTQNPWTGLLGQVYDHLHNQTTGLYGCRSAAEPIHVQLNRATYFIEGFAILSRNFYWLHFQGGDYKLLETYRTKKIPLKMKSSVFIGGSTYQIQIHIENLSNTTNFKTLSCKNHVIDRHDNDYDIGSVEPVEIPSEKSHNYGLLQRIYRQFSTGGDGMNFVETNGTDSGVAFFLHFSVHATKKDKQEGEDTRIFQCIILRNNAICRN
ncbi:hypothetical protein GIB67_037905 [Kingdonia uniflora]|uniref:Uncharacterized protein n=1 Tax=Kingdonia uniflora TaxID=39325 RepID=A0A7J7LH27_9MAGN|nr:hypothetical protein GIB67_037905 [Kingdonia uniflora]